MGVFNQTVPRRGEGFEVPEAGSQPAVLVGVIDLGTQKDFADQERSSRRVFLVWELTEARMSGQNRNHVLAKDYNLSLHEKASLRKLVEAWRGRPLKEDEGFDVSVLLGKPCLLTVAHKEGSRGTFAVVGGVAAMPRGMAAPVATLPLVRWEIGDGPIPAQNWLPWVYGQPLAEKIKQSPEWKAYAGAGNGQAAAAPAGEESIPF